MERFAQVSVRFSPLNPFFLMCPFFSVFPYYAVRSSGGRHSCFCFILSFSSLKQPFLSVSTIRKSKKNYIFAQNLEYRHIYVCPSCEKSSSIAEISLPFHFSCSCSFFSKIGQNYELRLPQKENDTFEHRVKRWGHGPISVKKTISTSSQKKKYFF